MKAQTYRPKIQNGQVARRGVRTTGRTGSKSSSKKSRAAGAARGGSARRRQSEQAQGAKVLWSLIIIGAVVATGFVFGLHSQINAHQLGQAEAQLKSELDEISNRQRFEILEQRRALNPRESDRAAKQAGLIQPKLNQSGGAKAGLEPTPTQTKKERVHQRPGAGSQQHR